MKQIDSLGSEVRAARKPRFRRGGAVLSSSVKTLWRMALGGVAALTLVAACVSTAGAAVYTRFDSPDYENDWGIAHHGSTTAVTIGSGPGGANALRIFRPTGGAASNNAFVYYNGTEEGFSGGKVADFELTTTLSLSATANDSVAGVMIRAQDTSYTAGNGYFIGISSRDGGGLYIFDSPTNHASVWANALDSDLGFGFNANAYYQLKISAIGSVISASLWTEDGLTKLAEVEYTSARTNEGYLGLRSGLANSNVSQYVKDISITVIPEPATIGFALMGGAAMLVVLRRRHGLRGDF